MSRKLISGVSSRCQRSRSMRATDSAVRWASSAVRFAVWELRSADRAAFMALYAAQPLKAAATAAMPPSTMSMRAFNP
ncbi:hypothetical protein SF23_14350 [Streptomyces sp. MBRL 10]|nr:hypothetical protein SF23_14350 [Streptomyces sp. MBRL 10]